MGFKESDTPNFTGSYYSHTKAIVENLLKVGARGGTLAVVLLRLAARHLYTFCCQQTRCVPLRRPLSPQPP